MAPFNPIPYWARVLTGALLAVAGALLIGGPAGQGLVVHDPALALPTIRDGKKLNYKRDLAKVRPRMVFVGNSVLGTSFKNDELSRLLGCSTLRLTLPGSFSALWYVVIKNLVLPADPQPEVVVVGFRDTYLTEPTHHTTGNYKRRLDYFVEPNEPLLDRLAYLPNANPITLWVTEHAGFVKRRESLRTSSEEFFKYKLTGAILGLGRGRITRAVNQSFADDQKSQALLSRAQLDADIEIPKEHFRFSQRVEQSFLPHMIDLVRGNGMQLVLVRMRPRRWAQADIDPTSLPEWSKGDLSAYNHALEAYLSEKGVPIVDLSRNRAITLDWYGNGDHIKEGWGQDQFTPLFADLIREFVPGM